MDAVPIDELARLIGGRVVGRHPDRAGAVATVVQHVATHSGRIGSGAAFFALQGEESDGHDFVADAARNGAAVAVVGRGRFAAAATGEAPDLGSMPLVEVDDPLRSLQLLAAWWRRQLDATTVVAVVGSNGKTITKDCLAHVVGSERVVYATPGSYNSQLGVPLAILGCPREAEVAIIEVAVSEPGEMRTHAEVVAPDRVVLTNVGTRWQHRFADRSARIAELLSIAADLPERGWLLLGESDDELRVAAGRLGHRWFAQGASPELPAFGEIAHGARTADLDVTFPEGTVARLSVRTPSDEVLSDVTLALSAGHALGIGVPSLVDALADYTPTATRMETWRSPDGVSFIRDVATPDPMAVIAAVRATRRLATGGGRTVVVLAEPASSWQDEEAVGLAQALVAERVDTVYGLTVPFHRRLAELIDGFGVDVEIRLWPTADDLRRDLLEHLARGDSCLVQSPAWRPLGDVMSSVMESLAPTRLYLDLSALDDNVTTFRRAVGPSVAIMAMVKALAYGTDAVNVSLALQQSGVDVLGVSGADEGVALRRAGVALPIVVMLGTGSEVDKMLRYRLTPMVYSPEMLAAVSTAAAAASASPSPSAWSPAGATGTFGVHIEVDSGMHRSGLPPSEAKDAIRLLSDLPGVRVEGLMTHLACADDPSEDDATGEQLARYDDVVAFAHSLGLRPACHAAATAAAIRRPSARYDMVRIGLGLFGLHPSKATAAELDLEPVAGLVSRIVQIVDVPAGERVGYGGTYAAPAPGGRVGVVPAGYHDCVPRALSNFGSVVVAGVRCPIVGRVSMDSMTIDVSQCPEATVGSDVLILGRHGDWRVPLEEAAEVIATIPYELMARVGPRVQRIFTRH